MKNPICKAILQKQLTIADSALGDPLSASPVPFDRDFFGSALDYQGNDFGQSDDDEIEHMGMEDIYDEEM